jgi:DNA-binding MarR family transcriptional regulator
VAAKIKKIGTVKTMKALSLWHGVTSAALLQMPVDLSARQTAILLTVHMKSGPHSIKSLAKNLSISKPAVCRAIDVLENEKLLRRVADKKDKRNILLLPSAKGTAYLQELGNMIASISKDAA